MSIEEFLPSRSVFRDISKLSFDYVPDELVHREEAQRRLTTLFSPLLSGRSQNVLITGSVGVGKTALALWFCREFKSAASKKERNVEYLLVNCRRRKTTASALLAILNHFAFFPDRGFSVSEMLDNLANHLSRGTDLIIVLDEVDYLLRKSGSELIYLLTRFYDERPEAKGSISTILISQKFILNMLEPSALSTFKRGNHIHLDEYSRDEIFDIIMQRVDLAFHPGAVGTDIVDLLADIAGERGDARYAIELLEKAGLLADEKGAGRVSVEDARAAKAMIHPVVGRDVIATLAHHERLVLLSAVRCLRDIPYTTTGDVEEVYRVICEEFEEEPRGHTQFWKYLKSLSSQGLLETKVSSKDGAGRTTVIKLSLHDIPATSLEEMILESIGH